jgi:hypothetical protein
MTKEGLMLNVGRNATGRIISSRWPTVMLQ